MTERSTLSTTPSPAPVPGADDLELAARFVAGEPAAVDRVRRWIRGALTPYRLSLAAEIDDIEAEVLVSLLETLRDDRFEGRSRLATYVRRTVLYRCINRLRDRRKRETVPLDDGVHAATEPSPEQAAAQTEETRAALRVMARMPAVCRELWAMLLRGLDYHAMAQRTGVASGTLRVRMLRCRQSAVAQWRELTGEAR